MSLISKMFKIFICREYEQRTFPYFSDVFYVVVRTSQVLKRSRCLDSQFYLRFHSLRSVINVSCRCQKCWNFGKSSTGSGRAACRSWYVRYWDHTYQHRFSYARHDIGHQQHRSWNQYVPLRCSQLGQRWSDVADWAALWAFWITLKAHFHFLFCFFSDVIRELK